jgi:hypothetical protein
MLNKNLNRFSFSSWQHNKQWIKSTFIGMVVLSMLMTAVGVFALVPAFPDNIAVFPDRDFVSVEGYEQHAGETALVEVTRGTTVIGSAQAIVEAGGVAFEVNHPGGVCWGNGTNLQVTPDIRPGDVVSIKFLDGTPASLLIADSETTTSDAFVTADSILTPGTSTNPAGATLTVVGHAGADIINSGFFEQRIINGELVDTAVGKRDIRALPGPLTPAVSGVYSSGVTFDLASLTFTATYEFDDPALAQIAANADLGERAMAWQEQDAAANRQGLTIAEFGEPGGPGMGGCPAGPNQAGTPVPGSAFATRSADTTPGTDKIKIDWTSVISVPTAPVVTGYSIVAIASNANAAGERVQIGTRVGPTATTTTIRGLSSTESYTIEVRSSATAADGSVTLSAAFPLLAPVSGDTIAPILTATPAPGLTSATAVATASVTLTASDATATNIYYTLDGSPVFTSDGPSDTALRYTSPIQVTSATPIELRAVAFDTSNNHSDPITNGFYVQGAAPAVPAAPINLVAAAGQASMTATWSAPVGDTTVIGYLVQLYKNGLVDGALRPTTARSLTISGLTVGASYSFTVSASNTVGSGEASVMSNAVVPTPITDRITITSARWKLNDFRVIGTGSQVGAIVTIRVGTPGCATLGTLIGSGSVVAGVPTGTFDIRFRSSPRQPATVCAFSNGGGVAGPFTTTR